MAATGRPSKYNEDMAINLVRHMEKGLSFESYGAVIHVAKETMNDWCRPFETDGVTPNPRYHEAFSAAKKEGEQRSMLLWERIGVHATLGIPFEYTDEAGTKHSATSFNPTIWIFNMKNRFGWRDRLDATSGDAPIENTGHQALKEIAEVLRDANKHLTPNDPARSPAEPTGDAGTGEAAS